MKRNRVEVFNRSPSDFYISEKKKEIDTWGKSLYGTTEIAKEENLLEELAKFCGFEETNDIREIALQLEEDIAVINKGVLSAICFCFPSSWVPSERLGASLSELHEPVGDGDQLIQASSKLSKVMQRQNILRWIWTITTNSSLSNHPEYERPELIGMENLYLRVETQTSAPLTEESSLFFVKVYVFPLNQVWSDSILESINSMSEEVLLYKNLKEIKDFLNEPNRCFN